MKETQDDQDEIYIVDLADKGFTVVGRWILDLPLRSTVKMVFIALKSFSGYSEIRPSLRTVARRAGCSRSTVKRCIQVLVKKKLVFVKKGKRPDGGDGANVYILVKPAGSPLIQNEPGAKLSPAQVQYDLGAGSTVNPQKDIKQKNKKKHTSKHISVEDINRTLTGDFASVDRNWVSDQIALTGRTEDEVLADLDRMVWQYSKSNSSAVRNPQSLVSRAIWQGWSAPNGYIPLEERQRRAQRNEDAATKAKIEKQSRINEEKKRLEIVTERFYQLSDSEQNKYLTKYAWMELSQRESAAIGAFMQDERHLKLEGI